MATRFDVNALSYKVIGCAIKVHSVLGPGLLESAYQSSLSEELERSGMKVEAERPLPVVYGGARVECGYRVDLIVNELVIVEIKAVQEISPIHIAQTLTYLRLSGLPLALLINFNTRLLKSGIRRLINDRVLPPGASETLAPEDTKSIP